MGTRNRFAQRIVTVSMRQPSLEPLLSLAIRQRNLALGGDERQVDDGA